MSPTTGDWSSGQVPPKFKVHGLYVEDPKDSTAFRVCCRDPQTETIVPLTVIGILRRLGDLRDVGRSTSQRTLTRAFGDLAQPTHYYFYAPGTESIRGATAKTLESTFLQNGVEADALGEGPGGTRGGEAGPSTGSFRDSWGSACSSASRRSASSAPARLSSGASRSGSCGRSASSGAAIQAAFLIESSFVALTAIVVGTLLGLVLAHNVVADAASGSMYAGITMAVPWLNLTIVFVTVYAVALLTKLGPGAARFTRLSRGSADGRSRG